MRLLRLVGICVLPLLGVRPAESQTADAKVAQIADRFVNQQLAYDPSIAYSDGLATTTNDRFADRRPAALAAFDKEEQDDLTQLDSIDIQHLSAASRATYANLREQLESDLQLRVCRTELWNVNHFDGWPSHFAEVARQQPVATEDDRRQALVRWGTVPGYVDIEIANLRSGLARGYSAPKSVVRREIRQMDQLVSTTPEKSPFYSPAARSGDLKFQDAFRNLIVESIDPGLRRYRDYLQTEYLPNARDSIAISDLPNGKACYAAFLRANTTLRSSAQQIYDLGQKTVAANVSAVEEIGKRNYGSSNIPAILTAIKAKPAEHFQSKDDLLAFSQRFVKRALEITAARLIDIMPPQAVIILPLPAFEEAAGVGSRFEQQPDPGKPAVYLIQLNDWKSETRAEAEIATVHETVPGHYLQKALARQLQPPTPLSKLIDNSAYSEGWARYAEGLAEEAHIYDTEDAAIMRRLWPARGMVVDPGLHAFHWTRQRAIDYMVASGRFTPAEADDYVDRIAVMPGQLTSYDTGALTIESLRREAQSKLGSRFDLRRFNHALLEEGVVPLGELRSHIEQWIALQTKY